MLYSDDDRLLISATSLGGGQGNPVTSSLINEFGSDANLTKRNFYSTNLQVTSSIDANDLQTDVAYDHPGTTILNGLSAGTGQLVRRADDNGIVKQSQPMRTSTTILTVA